MPPRSHGPGRFERAQLGSCPDSVVIEEGALVFHPERVFLGRVDGIGRGFDQHLGRHGVGGLAERRHGLLDPFIKTPGGPTAGDRIVEHAKKACFRPMGVEGERDGEWVLVDLQDIIVHIMLPRVREFYRLESLWDISAARREAVSVSV